MPVIEVMITDEAQEYNDAINEICEKQNNLCKIGIKQTHITKAGINNIHQDLNRNANQNYNILKELNVTLVKMCIFYSAKLGFLG